MDVSAQPIKLGSSGSLSADLTLSAVTSSSMRTGASPNCSGRWRGQDCWQIAAALEAALGDAGADELPRELGRNPPFGSEEQVNAYVVEQLKALSE